MRATQNQGVDELIAKLRNIHSQVAMQTKKTYLLAEKAYRLIQQKDEINTEKALFEALAELQTSI